MMATRRRSPLWCNEVSFTIDKTKSSPICLAPTAWWIGKPIEIHHDPNVMLGRDRVGGIRVRIPTEGRPAANRATSANGATPKVAPAPAPIAPPPPGPPLTLDQRQAQLLSGFDGALTEDNLRAWGRWGKQFPFTEPQQGEAEDRFHDALARIALAQAPTRRAARASINDTAPPSPGRAYFLFDSRKEGAWARVKSTTSSPVTVLISWCRLNTLTPVTS